MTEIKIRDRGLGMPLVSMSVEKWQMVVDALIGFEDTRDIAVLIASQINN